MKKVVFLFATLFAVYAAIAQNTATTTQTGDNNEATITQLGNLNNSVILSNGNSNKSTALMYGNENVTNVEQQGNGNSTDVRIGFQTNKTYPSNKNEVAILQVGDNNNVISGLTWGDENKDRIEQRGDANYFEIGVKYGNLNEITEITEGNENRTRFSVPANWGSFSDGNKLTITKAGDKNYVSGKMQGDLNTVTIDQVGDLNKVGTSWYTEDGVSIEGSSNMVDILQNGTANQSLNSILGNQNAIGVAQYGIGNLCTTSIVGNLNTISVVQDNR